MGDFIFEKTEDGNLNFVGDFDGLYKTDEDPWGQTGSSSDVEMNKFYLKSRVALAQELSNEIPQGSSVLEIGCGTGDTTAIVSKAIANSKTTGCDISPTAVQKASKRFPDLNFEVLNILHSGSENKYNLIILSNMIWYVLHEKDALASNLASSLKLDEEEPCYLVAHNALFRESSFTLKRKYLFRHLF